MSEALDRVKARIIAADSLGTTKILLDLKDVKQLVNDLTPRCRATPGCRLPEGHGGDRCNTFDPDGHP